MGSSSNVDLASDDGPFDSIFETSGSFSFVD